MKRKFLTVIVALICVAACVCALVACNDDSDTVDVASVALDKSSLTLEVGGEATLTATVTPDNATDKTVVWSSDNTAVAIVFGVIATLILGGGMSMVMLETANVSYLAGGILLGLAGIVLCCINYPLYKIISAKKTKQVLPLIDDNEEKLAIIMEKGNDLLHTDMI